MPVKKSKEDILYTEKPLSRNTPHPIKVGCGDISIPLYTERKDKSKNHTRAVINVFADLNESNKGSNISNIVKIINKQENYSFGTLINTLLKSEDPKIFDKYIKISFDFIYFLRKKALVSKEESWSSYKSILTVEKIEDDVKYYLKTCVPYASLCPTSKDISDYGAHNQRSLAEIEVELVNFTENNEFWIEDIVYLVDHCVSCPTFNIAHLEDEAFQTEMMYENPLFVEEVALKIAKSLDKHIDKEIKGYKFTLNHYESINDYTVKAILEK
jgi:GTP cyclohydrolase I